MAQVDPEDDSILRFIVRHYRYDPQRRERRHVVVAAFDNEAEYQARLQSEAAEIQRRRTTGRPSIDESMLQDWSTSRAIYAERPTGTCCRVRSRAEFRRKGSNVSNCPPTCPT